MIEYYTKLVYNKSTISVKTDNGSFAKQKLDSLDLYKGLTILKIFQKQHLESTEESGYT